MHCYPRLSAQSSVYGKIEQLLLVYPGDPREISREDILDRFGSLFEHLGDRVTYIILSNYSQPLDVSDYLEARESFTKAFSHALLKSHLYPNHHTIHIPAPLTAPVQDLKDGEPHLNHSQFVQDPFVVMQTTNRESVLLESFRTLNPKNQMVAEQLAAATGMFIRPTEYWLEGGNILVGSDFALVGENLLHRNLELLFPGKNLEDETPGDSGRQTIKEAITTNFKQLLGVRYLQWLGSTSGILKKLKVDQGKHRLQPFFHLDHYLTLAGMSRDGDELVLVGKINFDHVVGFKEEFRADLSQLNTLLDEVVSQLRKSGRVFPGPRFEFQTLPMGGSIEKEMDEKGKVIGHRFHPFSYNNAQVEWYHGVKRIYLPRYEQTETLEEEIMSDLVGKGFSPVRFIAHAFDHHAIQGGALHCMTKVLKRSIY
ncbi:MAG TPA: hypothetical protein ENJ82_14300 [Bacteroidetes bacterium]|nr:hypothetical protein [Bacteroidota bacterium]